MYFFKEESYIGEVINMLSTHKIPRILADKNRKNIISPKELIKFA